MEEPFGSLFGHSDITCYSSVPPFVPLFLCLVLIDGPALPTVDMPSVFGHRKWTTTTTTMSGVGLPIDLPPPPCIFPHCFSSETIGCGCQLGSVQCIDECIQRSPNLQNWSLQVPLSSGIHTRIHKQSEKDGWWTKYIDTLHKYKWPPQKADRPIDGWVGSRQLGVLGIAWNMGLHNNMAHHRYISKVKAAAAAAQR